MENLENKNPDSDVNDSGALTPEEKTKLQAEGLLTPDPVNTEDDAKDPEKKPEEQDDTNKDPEGEEGSQGENDKSKAQPTQFEKTAYALAALRAENTKYKNVLKNLGTVLDINENDVKDPIAFADLINKQLNNQLAAKSNISPEIFEKLNSLEEKVQQSELEKRKNNTLIEMQSVKNKYSLTDQELETFAQTLVDEGKNPFVVDLDLEREYVFRNLDNIKAKAATEAAEAERLRLKEAQEHGSDLDPNSNGAADTDPKEINSEKDLEAFFKKNMK